MNNYKNAITLMEEMFSRDYQFAMATMVNDIPSLRFIDTYFDNGVFYAVTYANTHKVKEIAVNPNVALCSRKGYSFNGKAYNIGHPLLPKNSDIRSKLIKAFNPWYFKHNNENDNICILKMEPKSGFVHKDGIGYNINFVDKTVNTAPFDFNIVLTDE
ncbi:MAG: pyridoxamine 5'-phosphate oxidase family protein [Eubacterium sp.]|nr:pyridoxamine 5'-phosphate oxidase family protein [Eubacterium sp.]